MGINLNRFKIRLPGAGFLVSGLVGLGTFVVHNPQIVTGISGVLGTGGAAGVMIGLALTKKAVEDYSTAHPVDQTSAITQAVAQGVASAIGQHLTAIQAAVSVANEVAGAITRVTPAAVPTTEAVSGAVVNHGGADGSGI